MASVSFSFNLDPVTSASSQSASTAQTDQAAAATAAKFQAAGAGSHSTGAVGSPACDGSGCYIVHGDGPGVTTLSIGEEDGGGAGYLTLPVVDGSEFLAPPTNSIAASPSYEITTLAIGEEDGGVASAGTEIGASQPVAGPAQSDFQFSLDSTPLPRPSIAQAAPTVEFAQSSLAPIETVPLIEPRAKPTSVASAGAPLPEIKPAVIPAGLFATPAPISVASGGTQVAEASGANYRSVGDYDAYLSGMNKGDEGSTTAVAAAAPTTTTTTASAPVQVTETASLQPAVSATGQNPAAVYAPPPLAPLEVYEFAAPEPYVAVVYAPPPLAPLEPTNFASAASPDVPSDVTVTYNSPPPPPGAERIEVVLQPVATTPILPAGLDSVVAPRIKPASFTTPGPAVLGPIETVPIQSSPVFSSDLTSGAVISGPIPSEKPDAASLDAPRLTDEDFKITTLALGEEESGGG